MKYIQEFFRAAGLFIPLNILFISFFLASCAIVSSPTGGKKDVVPPKVLSESPRNKSVSFSGDKIVVRFDEFVELGDVFKEVIISPTLPRMPEITANRRTVTINFKKTPLQPNTTYSIQFGNAIKDLDEGNILKNYRFVFSTGPFLDSLAISGQAVKTLEGVPGKGIKIELYKAGNDSGIYKEKPLYYTRTDSAGDFKMDFLPKGKYSLYALDDKNDNYFIDEGENIGFPEHEITLDSLVHLSGPVQMFPYVAGQAQIRKVVLSRQMLQVRYVHPVDSVVIHSEDKFITDQFYQANEAKDSFTWYLRQEFPNVRVSAFINGVKSDSVVNLNKEARLVKFSYEISCSGDNGNLYGVPVLIRANKPVANVNKADIKLTADSIPVESHIRFIDSAHTIIGLMAAYDDSKTYKLKLWPGALESIYGDKMKDTVGAPLAIPGLRNFGNVEITTITPPGNYIFQLVSESGKVIFYKNVSRETLVKIPFVNPGSYRFRLIKDDNKNGEWDGGSIKNKTQPEAVYYFPKELSVKANWEMAGIKFDLTKLLAPATKP